MPARSAPSWAVHRTDANPGRSLRSPRRFVIAEPVVGLGPAWGSNPCRGAEHPAGPGHGRGAEHPAGPGHGRGAEHPAGPERGRGAERPARSRDSDVALSAQQGSGTRSWRRTWLGPSSTVELGPSERGLRQPRRVRSPPPGRRAG
jgi:hypothetical protein